jgi:hypothetical protein
LKSLKANGIGETNTTEKIGRKYRMLENENLVTEEVTENTEETAEETTAAEEVVAEKTYTQSELNEIMGKRLARQEAKIRKEYEKHNELAEVVKAGIGKEDVGEAADSLREFYIKKGYKMPEKKQDTRDIEVLARADAEEFIADGFDEVVREVDRLTEKGVANMTPREKAMFKVLAEHRQATENSQELERIGVPKDVAESKDFKDFAAQFNPKTPIADIYDIYNKTKPKKNYQTIGSMKQSQESKVKDYYSPEEIERLTEEDLDDPKVWEAVRRSMTGS